jgi:hypothetical protein
MNILFHIYTIARYVCLITLNFRFDKTGGFSSLAKQPVDIQEGVFSIEAVLLLAS